MHEHRIYKHICAPFRVCGLTLDELGCGLGGLTLSFYNMGDIMLQITFLSLGCAGLWGLKKIKRLGVQLRSYLAWHVITLGVSATYPPREWRILLP